MVLSVSNYDDFKVIVSQLDCNKTVFSCVVSANQFEAAGLNNNGAVAVSLNTDTLPSTFNTDFPHAIALTTNFGISG